MNKKLLYTISFFIKGLEVGILLLLPVFQTQGIITVFQVGLLGATMSSFQIISNLQTGHLAEKFGGKNILALGIGMYATAWLSLGILPNVEILFFAYALAGIGSGVFIPIANSFVVKISDKNRSTEMGNFSAYTDLGRVLFSSVTIILVGLFSTARTSLFYAVSALILLLIFISRIKRNRDMHEALSSEENLEKIKILSLLKEKRYVLSVITGIFDGFSSASLYIFIPLLLVPRGIFLSTIGLLSSLFFLGYFSGRLLLGRLADRYGAEKILVLAQVCMAFLIGGIIFAHNIFIIAIILFLLGIFTRGTSPIIRAMVAEAVDEKRKLNRAYGFYSFAVNSSSMASRLIFGILVGSLGITSVFYLSSLVALLTIIPITVYSNHRKHSS